MEPTSEQELKQLLDEGKINEEEYKELIETIRQKETVQKPIEVSQKSAELKPRSGYGKAAMILMIAGFLVIFLPLILTMIIARGMPARSAFLLQPARIIGVTACPFLFLGFLCELLAFIFGLMGWRSGPGKFAAIGVPCLGIFILFVLPVVGLLAGMFAAKAATELTLVSHQAYPLDSMEGILTRDGIEFDEQMSFDGNGALRIQTQSPDKTIVRLFETGPVSIEDRMLVYSARLRSDALNGKAYLEMWCDIPGKGEFFSRGLDQPIAGTTEWTNAQTPFRLETGQMPANVKLNVVVEGIGTVWIDDIKLLSSPLSELRNKNSWH